jgi:hypothetical protein
MGDKTGVSIRWVVAFLVAAALALAILIALVAKRGDAEKPGYTGQDKRKVVE